MEYKLLKNIAQITMGQSPDSSSYNEEEKGLPFYQGNADFGELYPTARVWCDAPKKIASKGDILISVRAPIGALNYASEDCCIGRGLAAITIKNEAEKNYVYHLLKARKTDLNSKGTGSTFKAIGKSVLEEVQVPVISREQQEISMQLMDTIENVIRQRKKELRLLDELVKARFVEMFGDPVSNSYGLPEATLPELGEFGRGVSKHRPRNDPKLLGGEYPLIQTGDVANAGLYITSYNSTYSELGLKQSKMWDKGTLCITIAANIAKTAILEFDACFPDSVVGFTANERTNNVFIHYWFSFFQAILESQAPESAQKNINLKILSELKVIVPEKNKLDAFMEFVKQVDKSKLMEWSGRDGFQRWNETGRWK